MFVHISIDIYIRIFTHIFTPRCTHSHMDKIVHMCTSYLLLCGSNLTYYKYDVSYVNLYMYVDYAQTDTDTDTDIDADTHTNIDQIQT